MIKSTEILNLLKEFSKGREVVIKNYALKCELSERTIRRYIKELMDFFGKNFITSISKGVYICKNKELFKDFFTSNEFINESEKLIDLLHIINPDFAKYLPNSHKKIDEKLAKELADVFLIRGSPHENTPNLKIFGLIQKAIKFRRYIDIIYDEIKLQNVKPIKIIYSKGNWQLALLQKDISKNNGFLAIRLNFIQNVKIKKDSFYIDEYALNFVKNSDIFWDGYKKEIYKSQAMISHKIVKYFKVKKFFKSQIIYDEIYKNGWQKIEFEITSDAMILMLARRFFPEFIIISPTSAKAKFNALVMDYKNNCDLFN